MEELFLNAFTQFGAAGVLFVVMFAYARDRFKFMNNEYSSLKESFKKLSDEYNNNIKENSEKYFQVITERTQLDKKLINTLDKFLETYEKKMK